MNGMAASDKIFGLLDLKEVESGESYFPQVELDISLDDVHFAYEKDREILKGITMNFLQIALFPLLVNLAVERVHWLAF